jgi:hypothetical protein
MPKLTRVTITGADDSTDISQMIALSHEFPFVEWGILVSDSQEGSYRFPSRNWINNLIAATAPINRRNEEKVICFSTHMCGMWVRHLLIGELDWNEVPNIVRCSERIQINTHSSYHAYLEDFFKNLKDVPGPSEYIFQWDNVNNNLAYELLDHFGPGNVNVSALFDTSGGAGKLPECWPEDPLNIPVGYAGGLGPDNVVEQLKLIRKSAQQDFWIDMERRVRTEDDSTLDMTKVRKVLELMAPEINI